MALVLEIVVVVAVIYAVTKIVLKVLSDRKELVQLREERAARLATARTAEELARELLLDKELGQAVYEQLGRQLDEESSSPRPATTKDPELPPPSADEGNEP